MIKLYGFGANFGAADPSPFVLKVDLYMRMAGIEFETIADMSNLRKAPKGKLPFIDDEGLRLGDSFFIIDHLKTKYAVELDQHLSDEQQAVAHLVSKSLDEGLYWSLVYSRWICDDTWPTIRQAFFGKLPFPLKQLVPPLARRGVVSALKKQGLGNHSVDEIQKIMNRSLQSLSAMLGHKAYFFGDKPSSFDASAFAFLTNFILIEIDNPFNEIARGYPNLVSYCQRINSEFYPACKQEKAA